MRRLQHIDALRGWAAFIVIVYHVSFRCKGLSPALLGFCSLGARGVQLFYVLSAFSLFFALREREQKGGFSSKQFFVRRFFRIAPLFYLAILFYLWLYGFGPRYMLGPTGSVTALNIMSVVLFINGISPYWINSIVPVGWSVAVEMNFYLFIPWLYKHVKSFSRAMLYFVIALVFAVVVYQLLTQHVIILIPEKEIWKKEIWSEFRFLWFPNQLPVFLLGIALFFVPELPEQIQGLRRYATGAGLLAVSLLLALYCTRLSSYWFPAHITFGLASAILVYALSCWPSAILVNRVTIWLGAISYSLYLTHTACLRWSLMLSKGWVGYLGPNGYFIALLAITTVSASLLSYVTYRLVELPGQKLGSKLLSHS